MDSITQKVLDEQRENEKQEVIAILKEYTEVKVNEDGSISSKTVEEIAEMIMLVGSVPEHKE